MRNGGLVGSQQEIEDLGLQAAAQASLRLVAAGCTQPNPWRGSQPCNCYEQRLVMCKAQRWRMGHPQPTWPQGPPIIRAVLRELHRPYQTLQSWLDCHSADLTIRQLFLMVGE